MRSESTHTANHTQPTLRTQQHPPHNQQRSHPPHPPHPVPSPSDPTTTTAATPATADPDAALHSGPLSLLSTAVATSTPVLINLRNNRKLLARIKAFDRHMNMVLEGVTEMWTERAGAGAGKGKKKARGVNRDRLIAKMFLRGDSVILVVANPKVSDS